MKLLSLKHFPGFFPIEKLTTDHNYLEVNRRHGHFVLDSGNVNYSFGALHEIFQKAFKKAGREVSSFQKALLLGFGAGSVSYILQNELNFKGKITGVEIDTKIVELARKYFGLDAIQNLNIEVTDAFDFVFQDQQKYDLIVVDLFIDHIIPEKFDQKDFLNQLDRLLENDGMLLYNRMNQSFKDKLRIKTFRKAFADVFKTATVSEEFDIDSRNIIFHIKK